MHKYIKTSILSFLFVLAGCAVQQDPVTELNTFNFPYKKEVTQYEADKNAKAFLKIFNDTLREVNAEYLVNKNNPIIRAGTFDLSDHLNKTRVSDTNHSLTTAFLKTGYRPIAMYGSNFTDINPYCPIYYSWEKNLNISYYYQKFFIFDPISIANGISFSDIAQYLALVSFKNCTIMDEAYRGKKPLPSPEQIRKLGDSFAIEYFLKNNKIDMALFIEEKSLQLHNLTQ